VSKLTNPVTGHQITTDDESVEFWQAAGYRAEQDKAPAKKAASKKTSTTKK
jgi:hypothetical protein